MQEYSIIYTEYFVEARETKKERDLASAIICTMWASNAPLVRLSVFLLL